MAIQPGATLFTVIPYFATSIARLVGAETPFREGRRLINEKKLDEALTAFQQAAKLSPDTAVIHYWVGMTYFYKRESEKAIAQFMKVLALEPDNYRANAMIGRSLLTDRSKIDQAVEYFKKALSINPEYMDARFELGRIFAFKGDMKRSLAEFSILVIGNQSVTDPVLATLALLVVGVVLLAVGFTFVVITVLIGKGAIIIDKEIASIVEKAFGTREDRISSLERLAVLRDKGVLTEKEFMLEKELILSQNSYEED